MSAKRVFMILPYLGQVEDESRRAAYLYPTHRYNVLCRPIKASLLAYGLNVRWAEMENGWSEDGYVSGVFDYLVILHADCSPQMWWLDTMIDELEEHKLDCLHASVAIKNDSRHSSTALGSITDEDYRIRKLSLKEIHDDLPLTYTIGDVKRKLKGQGDLHPLNTLGFAPNDELALLPNTGVFVLKVADDGVRRPWVKTFPGFHIRDWFDRQEGKPTEARVMSEDWGFGVWAAKAGLKVGGTRKVVVKHKGTADYSNERPTDGEARDEAFLRWAGASK